MSKRAPEYIGATECARCGAQIAETLDGLCCACRYGKMAHTEAVESGARPDAIDHFSEDCGFRLWDLGEEIRLGLWVEMK